MALTDDQVKAVRLTVAGLSSTDVAKIIDVDRRTINRWKKKYKEFNQTLKTLRKQRVIRSYDIREAIHYEACRLVYLWLTGETKALGKRISRVDLREAIKIANDFNPCPKWDQDRDPRDEKILGGKISESDLEPMPVEEINKINKENNDLSQKEQILKKNKKAWQWLTETSMRLLHLTNSREAAKTTLKEHYGISDTLTTMVVDEAAESLAAITKDGLNGLFGTRVDESTIERHNMKTALDASMNSNPGSVLTNLTRIKTNNSTGGGETIDPVEVLLEQIKTRPKYDREFYKKAGCWPEEHDDPKSVRVELEKSN